MNKVDWDNLVAEHLPSFGAFLQSYAWGEFQASLGFKVVRVAEQVEGQWVIAQAIKHTLPLGQSYWYVPKGPLGNAKFEIALGVLRQHLPGGAWLKLEPGMKPATGYRVHDHQPAVTSMLDLTLPEAELSAAMKPKTRYNIRLAEKKGVSVKFVELDQFEAFASLMRQTAERDHFSLHELARYKLLLEHLRTPSCRAFLAMAFYEDLPLSANIMLDAFGTRTYLHGASGNLYRNVMAPYALHDVLIRDAKARGLKTYDFWGIAPPEAGETHAWAGISKFKLGFGGQVARMPGTFDVPNQKALYGLYRLAKRFRK